MQVVSIFLHWEFQWDSEDKMLVSSSERIHKVSLFSVKFFLATLHLKCFLYPRHKQESYDALTIN